jgi:CHAD domain-containing protein
MDCKQQRMSLSTSANQSIYSVLLLAIRQSWSTYSSLVQVNRSLPNRKRVHDLRTRLRRLTITLDLVQDLSSGSRKTVDTANWVKKLRKQLKEELHSLRDLRDLQSQEKSFDRKLHDPLLVEFHHSLQLRIKKNQKTVKNYFRAVSLRKQQKLLKKIQDSILSYPTTASAKKSSKRRMTAIMLQRYQSFQRCAMKAQSSKPSSLHQARIEFKKFRYTWDALSPLFPRSKSTDHNIKSIQDLLGHIQDSVVSTELLIRYLIENQNSQPSPDYLQYLHNIHLSQVREAEYFLSHRHQLLAQVNPQKIHNRI